MKRSLYSNGMIGGEDLTNEIASIEQNAMKLRERLLGSDLVSEDEVEYSEEAPMPGTAEADPVGA